MMTSDYVDKALVIAWQYILSLLFSIFKDTLMFTMVYCQYRIVHIHEDYVLKVLYYEFP